MKNNIIDKCLKNIQESNVAELKKQIRHHPDIVFYYFDDEKLLIELCVDHGILTLPLYKTILGVGGASNPIFSTGYTLLFTLREMKDERTISGEMMRRGERLSPPEQIICLFSGSTGAYAEADHTTFDEIKCSMQVCKSVISILNMHPELAYYRNHEGANFLFYSAESFHYKEISQKLFSLGASPNVFTYRNLSPLGRINPYAYPEYYDFFVKYGAQLSHVEKAFSVLRDCINNKDISILESFTKKMEKAEIYYHDPIWGKNLINYAIWIADNNDVAFLISVIKLLLSLHVPADSVDSNYNTCFHELMIRQFNDLSELGKMLLEKGAQINAQNFNGETALNFAVEEGFFEAVVFFIENGADKTILNDEGKNALMIAQRKDHFSRQKILTYLQKH